MQLIFLYIFLVWFSSFGVAIAATEPARYPIPTPPAEFESFNFGTPTSTSLSVSFPDSSSTFQPAPDVRDALENISDVSMVYINGRTSSRIPSAKDDALAFNRAASARLYLIRRGVSPLKVMVNFASAADYIADNSTPEGRFENQRVDIELIYIPTY